MVRETQFSGAELPKSKLGKMLRREMREEERRKVME
jgi:acyl-CoA synthetase (AMP-forming)/AMP-acid ligase II